MPFQVHAICPHTSARAGVLETAHGTVTTPVFMPVGTQATVKALAPDEVAAAGVRCLLANTYHLALRPGADLVEQLGGLHAFMGWPSPILTDSGGFQVMSLGGLREVTDHGVTFRSHLDESQHLFTPERVVHLQAQLGSDIAMVLDECVAYPCSFEEAAGAVQRTHAWALRSEHASRSAGQALFAIVQGSVYSDLRARSAAFLTQLDFDGFALGGLSVGEPKATTRAMLETTVPRLPMDRPRYLMGVGAPEDLIEFVGYGIDMFDCVLPTRLGRNASVFTWSGRLNVRRSEHARADRPIDWECRCFTCTHHTLAYLHHLFRAEEPLAHRLASLHNVAFLIALMARLRAAIMDGTYPAVRAELLARLAPALPVASGRR